MNDKVPCSSTKLIRGGTAYSSSPFELNLQLHGQVSNPYNFNIKQNYESSATTQVEFTYQEWTTPGTYTWIAPFTGTVTVCVIGGGGGGSLNTENTSNGSQSLFESIVASGGIRGYVEEGNYSYPGSGGSPNGRSGSKGSGTKVANGGSGGCRIDTYNIIKNNSYNIKVGSGGTGTGSNRSGYGNNGSSGAVAIWKQ